MLVVGCGVASFVAMRSTYESLLKTREAYYSAYRFADIFSNLKRAPEAVRKDIAKIPGVAEVQTRITAEVTIDLPDLSEPAQGRVVSIPDRQTPILNDLYFLRGRYIEPGKTDEVIISGGFAEANNFEPGDTLSAVLNGRWRKLRIVGIAFSPEFIYEIRPGDIFPDNKRYGVIWMSRDAAASAFQMEGAFNDVALTLGKDASKDSVIGHLDRVLESYGGFGAYDRNDQYSHRFLSNELGELQVFGTFIPAIFLAVTAFLLHLVLSRLVSTQREQIAVLKAFGYSNSDVGIHYLQLAFIAILGGIILGILVGMRLGIGMTNLYTDYFHLPLLEFEVSWQIVALSFFISLAASSIGALAAVRKAVLLPPAEAMRPEPPARFHEGFLERLGLQKAFSPEVRIIIRNLSRHPVKAALSALGISLSVILLFIGFFFFDAVKRIIDIQFNNVVREDVEVGFNDPRPGKVRFELAQMPGVLKVETYRSVPARLRFGYRSRRVGLSGIEPGADLRRIVDKNLELINLPPEGIVLNRTLADSLGVSEGEILTVEVMEGARPVRKIEVVKIVEELVGLSAYMDIHALNRLMNESDVINGAYLAIEADKSTKLYSELKQTPGVRSVGLPGVALKSFNETVAKTIGTSSSFLILFSCVITFGIVYNGARIALSERGRELASLRVLGFTRREIATMLLGEQAILTLLAIPFGFLAGYYTCLLITKVVDVEIVRLPMTLTQRTPIFSFTIVVVAALISGLLVAWRIRSLDLIEVLKTRE